MVRTRKTTASIQTSKPRTSLDCKSKRKRDEEDSEEGYVESSSVRKRRKPGTPQRSRHPQAQVENPSQDSEDSEKESSEGADEEQHTVLKRDWYLVRAVIDERFKEGSDGETKHQFLIDWVPSAQETYEPTWESAENLNADALKDWEKVKAKRKRQESRRETKRQKTRSRRGLRSLTPLTGQVETPAVNERQQLQTFNASLENHSRSNSLDQHVRSRNHFRPDPEPAFSEEPVPSIVSASSVEVESVGSPEFPTRPIRKFAVVLRKPDNFDPSEYESVHTSSQRISDLEDDDQRLAIASQLSRDTIPDSQDLSGHWDHSNLESQAAVQEPGGRGTLADPLRVTSSHSEADGQRKGTASPEIHSSADSFRFDQDFQVDESEIEASIRNQLLGDNQISHHYSSNHDHHLSGDSESLEAHNSNTTQGFSNSTGSYVPPDQQTEDNTLTNASAGKGKQVVGFRASETIGSSPSGHGTRSVQRASLDRSASSCHRSAGDRSANNHQLPESNISSRPSDREHLDTFNTKPSQRPTTPSQDATQVEAQPSSSSEVVHIIPDSQEYSNSSEELPPRASQSNKAQLTPFISQVEVVPDSATTNSDIPSRQPDQPRLPSLVREDVFDSCLSSDQGVHRRERTATASFQESSASNNTQSTPVFFTQPQGVHDSPVISSSVSRLETTEVAQSVLGQNTPLRSTDGSQKTKDREFDELQAAQPRSRIFDSQPERHVIGQDIESVSNSQPAQNKTKVNCDAERRFKKPSQTGSASEPPFELAKQPSKSREMERSYSQPRSSAADELKSFVDFGADSVLTQAGDGESLDETSYGASNEQEPMGSPGAAGLDIVVSSPEAIIQSQPIYSVDPWKPEVLGNTPDAPAPSISPASIMTNPHRSAVDEMRELITQAFSNSRDSITRSLLSQEPDDGLPPGTISPAAISRVADPLESTHTLNLANRGTMLSEIDSSGPSITMGQIPVEQDSDTSSQSSQQEDGYTQHVITLPMQASKRPYYGEIIKDYKAEIQAFSGLFTGNSGEQPDEALVQKIHDLFDKLFNICDYPPNVVGTVLESEPSADIAKFCCDSNPKFSFLFELMTALDDKDKEILIVTRNQELMRLIFALTEVAEIECSAESINKRTDFPSATRITLALWDEDFNPFNFDIVIGYDYRYIRSRIAMQLSSGTGRKSPIVLLMVTTYSAEHVSLHPLNNASALEELNAMLACTVSAGRYLEDPERGYSEPHEIAEIFARYLNGNTDTLSWEPQGIPDDVLDIFESPVSQNQLLFAVDSLHGSGHKRKFSDGGDAVDAKRTRTLPLRDPPVGSNNPPLPLATRRWLDGALLRGGANDREAIASVRVAVLDSLREQADEYKRKVSLAGEVEIELKNHINRLDKELRDFRKTSAKIGLSNRAAIQDRTVFEKQKSKAEAAAQAATVAAQKEGEKYKQRIGELESTINRLKETPGTAQREDALAAAQKQLQMTEDKLKSALADVDFMRSRYQDVDSTASRLSNEVNALKAQNGDLKQKASENLLAIHAQQASGERQIMQQQIANLQAQLQQKDAELVAAHQKLNSFANGRNTRGGSMPRSPRVPSGVSPRPSRVYTGSASRGTSPSGPGTQFMSQQVQNSRWNSLQ